MNPLFAASSFTARTTRGWAFERRLVTSVWTDVDRAFGLWWLDPIVALLIAGVALRGA
jgi:hypothetical protein